jgi:hypothetical protein
VPLISPQTCLARGIVLGYIWEMLDTLVPLLKSCNEKGSLIKWEGYQKLDQGKNLIVRSK